MVRIISGLVGLAFVAVLALALYGSVKGIMNDPAQATAVEEFHRHPKHVAFASDGLMGKFDRPQLQRGLQIYKEVCAACHSLSHVAFRDLTKIGYSEAQVKKFAADWASKKSVKDEKTGDVTEVPHTPADRFPTVYYAGQGNPPDLSLIAKARHSGPQYVYSLLTGYSDQPAELLKKFPDAKTPDGLYYNPYFATLNLAMPPPLADGAVTYADGTKNTLDQQAKDISAFLEWAAEPELEQRHAIGWAAIVFLLIASVLAYGAYRSVWRNVKH